MSFLGTVGVAIAGSAISAIGSASAAKKQARAAADAARQRAETEKKIAAGQRDFDKERADTRRDVATEALGLEWSGQQAATALERKVHEAEVRNVTASYASQKSYLREAGMKSLQDDISTVVENASMTMAAAMRDFQIRTQTMNMLMARRAEMTALEAGEVAAQAADEKSDRARAADQEMATMRVAMAEQGMSTTNGVLRMLNEAEYFKGVDIDRIERTAGARLDAMEHDLVTAAMQTSADLQMAEAALLETQESVDIGIRQSVRAISLKADELWQQWQNLSLQEVFDMESLQLTGEGLSQKESTAKAQYDFARGQISREFEEANKLADHIFDQSVTAADGGADAATAMAAAQSGAASLLAGTSFLSNTIQAGASVWSDFLNRQTQAKIFETQLGVPYKEAASLAGLDNFF